MTQEIIVAIIGISVLIILAIKLYNLFAGNDKSENNCGCSSCGCGTKRKEK